MVKRDGLVPFGRVCKDHFYSQDEMYCFANPPICQYYHRMYSYMYKKE